MASKFQLSKNVRDQLKELAEDLRADIDDLRNEFDERSDRWRESDAGNNAETWLDAVSDFLDELDELDTEVQS